MTSALELLKSAATTGFVGGKTPLEIFYSKIDVQIEYVKQAKEGKDLKQRSLWFRKDGAGYVVRIGRNAFEIIGSKLFRAADLDGVVTILDAAREAIKQDKKLQEHITQFSAERSERLKKGRAKNKAK
ncbi:hypothetical protein ACQKGL_02075 [Ensifer adhaerens]|uniref:hypothetical protein n=1 Tax=Ensifer adhaerens TaxID=106592 RepID=UPI003D02B947